MGLSELTMGGIAQTAGRTVVRAGGSTLVAGSTVAAQAAIVVGGMIIPGNAWQDGAQCSDCSCGGCPYPGDFEYFDEPIPPVMPAEETDPAPAPWDDANDDTTTDDPYCPQPNECNKRLSDWQIQNAGFDAHEIKYEILGGNANISRFELCLCNNGAVVIRNKGCKGPVIPTYYGIGM